MTTIRNGGKTLVIALLVGVIALGAGIAVAHNDGTEIRVTAMRHDDGRVEFAVQERDGEGWGERVLPRARFFPATGREGRWLNSTPVTVGVVEEAVATPGTAAAATLAHPFLGSGSFEGVIYVAVIDSVTGALVSGVTVDAPYGPGRNALLLVGCQAGALRAVLFTDESHSKLELGGDTVSYRISGQSAVAERWMIGGTLNTNVEPPDAASFIASLRGAQRLQVRTSETPVLTFDISNLLSTPVQVNVDNCGR